MISLHCLVVLTIWFCFTLLNILFVFRLCWVSVAVRGLSLVAALGLLLLRSSDARARRLQ